jgi:hypothetical protein
MWLLTFGYFHTQQVGDVAYFSEPVEYNVRHLIHGDLTLGV